MAWRATITGQWNPTFNPATAFPPTICELAKLLSGLFPPRQTILTTHGAGSPCVTMCSLLFLTLFFFCTFLHSLSPTLKCCIQLAKPGKLPLVSVNQEKNSGTHILMITELGKRHCFPSHQNRLLFRCWCFQLSSACFLFHGL